MTVLWTALVSGAGFLVVSVLVSAVRDEARGRLDRLPHALLRLASRRLPGDVRDELADEWEAELGAILVQARGLPITRLVTGGRYALGLLRAAPRVAGELTGAAPPGLPLRARVYVVGVVASAAAVIATSPIGGGWPTVAALALVFMVCESASFTSGHARVSSGTAVGLASVVLLGPAGAALVGVAAVVSGQQRLPPVKRIFNGAQFAMSGYAAGLAFRAWHDPSNQPGQPAWLEHVIGPFLGALVVFVSVNLLLVAGILLLTKQAAWRELLHEVYFLALGCVGYGMTGLLIAGLWMKIGIASAPLVLVPLFVARLVNTGQAGKAAPRPEEARHRTRSARPLLLAVAALAALGAISLAAPGPLVQPEAALAFGALIAIGELLRFAVPGDRDVAPIATAGALSYALLDAVGGEPARHSPLQAVVVAAAGMLLGALPHIAAGRPLRLEAMARRSLIVAMVALCFRPVLSLGLAWHGLLAVMCGVVAACCAADMLIAALLRAKTARTRIGAALRAEIAARSLLCTASGIAAVLLALATSVMGCTALLLFTVPILATCLAFRRSARMHAAKVAGSPGLSPGDGPTGLSL